MQRLAYTFERRVCLLATNRACAHILGGSPNLRGYIYKYIYNLLEPPGRKNDFFDGKGWAKGDEQSHIYPTVVGIQQLTVLWKRAKHMDGFPTMLNSFFSVKKMLPGSGRLSIYEQMNRAAYTRIIVTRAS